jgi:hypothetical protein
MDRGRRGTAVNNNEKLAIDVNPELALTVMRELKAACPQGYQQLLLETLGALTSRDLIFYGLGRLAGINASEAAFSSIIDALQGLEKGRKPDVQA